MKAKLTILLCIVIHCIAFAQEEKHQKFNNIPINGEISEIIPQLEEKGFKHLRTKNGIASFHGNLSGYRDIKVYAISLLKENCVYRICAVFGPSVDWDAIENCYNDLKVVLSIKYGKPKRVIEEISSDKQTKSSKFKALINNNCNYVSTFITNEGNINLTIDKYKKDKGAVFLYYDDKINSKKAKEELVENL